jgi:hypothetical protein
VQRLTLANGQSLIYKVQSPPTVEPEFYQQARSPILASARLLPIEGRPAALLLEEIQPPRLDESALSTREKFRITEEILSKIAQIEGELPGLFDIRSEAQWIAHTEVILNNLEVLVGSGVFQQVNAYTIKKIARYSRSADVLEALNGRTGYVHTDLCAENIIRLAEDYRVIDWQRPIWGPVDLDRAILLKSLGIDPAGQVSRGIIQISRLLLIDWFAQAARYWFPAGTPTYDREIVRLAKKELK